MSGGDDGKLTVMVVPGDGGRTRSVELSRRTAKVLAWCAGVVAVLVLVLAASWWYLALQAARIPGLQARIRLLEGERARVEELARELAAVESEYGELRDLFGSRLPAEAGELWLPPATEPSRGTGGSGDEAAVVTSRPDSWPLTVSGFLTQPLLEEAGGVHPGIDIAVPMDSYVRAAGAGRVVDVGEDPIYGRFVLLEHGDGYRTLYGHASQTLVERGDVVERNEVIALTGSTGRSTAPHLHFEVRRNGEPVNPMTLVEQP